MNLLNSILKVFVGDKAKKDIKEISPLVSKINSIEDEFIKLSNDELRSKTDKFKSEIFNIKNPYQIKIDLINEQLAGKHIYIARYYMNTSKWIAAIKRLDIVVNNYSSTIYITEALHRLVEIYYHLGNINEAKKYAAILGYNFNDSDWYKKTYKIVVDQDYTEEHTEQKRQQQFFESGTLDAASINNKNSIVSLTLSMDL